MEDLKKYLTAHPEIKELWLNGHNKFCLSANNHFPKHVTREEILGEDDGSSDVKYGSLKIDALKALIDDRKIEVGTATTKKEFIALLEAADGK